MGAGTHAIFHIRGEHVSHYTTNAIAVYQGMQSFPRLSIFDYPFDIIYRLLKMIPLLSKCVSLGEHGFRGCFYCHDWDANFVVRDINICQLVY